jgi:8-oxo-dGTP diphosphatase
VFLTRPGQVLLQKVPPGRGAWAGLHNGLGGHLEPGEDPLSGARREVLEEAGIRVEALHLRGVVIVDTGAAPGIGLYVFSGEAPSNAVASGPEGDLVWVRAADLAGIPLVEDLTQLLPRVLEKGEGEPFSAVYTYDGGALRIRFAE